MRLLIGLIAMIAFAADAAPTITAEQRAKFWRKQAEYVAASAQAQTAKVALDTVQAELVKACGDQQLVAGHDGEPTCQPKPEPAKKQAP